MPAYKRKGTKFWHMDSYHKGKRISKRIPTTRVIPQSRAAEGATAQSADEPGAALYRRHLVPPLAGSRGAPLPPPRARRPQDCPAVAGRRYIDGNTELPWES